MAEWFTKNLDLTGVNATFHLVRLVVLLVVLYMQWQQWREGRRSGYFVAFIAFASLSLTEFILVAFYVSGTLQHLDRPVNSHPLWGDYLQSLSLALFALSTPHLVLNASQKVKWKSPALCSILFLLLLLLPLHMLEATKPAFERTTNYRNALLSLYAMGFLSWAFIALSRLEHSRRRQILLALLFLIISQMLHFGYYIGLTLSWFPIHFGERIFSTIGYTVYVSFLHDHILAEKNQLMDELQRSNIELKRLDVLKNNFLSLASHELRTPLTAMHMAAVLLQSQKLADDERKKLTEIILRRSNAMTTLIEELLDISRIQLDRLEYQMAPLEINSLVRKTLEETQLVCSEKGLVVDESTWETELYTVGDLKKLSQVLQNLLANSIKSTAPGDRITVRCFAERDFAAISVEDTGVGIDPEHLPHVFDLFYHNDNANQTSTGVGLGLFIAKSIVEAHDGTITVNSAPNQGTTFTIWLKQMDIHDASIGEHERKVGALFQPMKTTEVSPDA